MENLKSKVAFYLNDSESTIGKIVDLILLGFNLLACTIFVVNCYVDDDILIMDIAEYSILVVFTVEYVLRVWTAKRRREYVLSFYGMIDLVSILPMIFTFEQFNFLRVLKVLRVLRFLRFLESDTFFFGRISPLQLQVSRTLFTGFTIFFVFSGFIFYAESDAPDAKIKTFGEAFYYCVVTITTVGFGDFVTVTALGRWITLAMILCGAIFIPWQAFKIVRLLIVSENGKRDIVCRNCGLKWHDRDASHCKACGSVIFQEYEGDA